MANQFLPADAILNQCILEARRVGLPEHAMSKFKVNDLELYNPYLSPVPYDTLDLLLSLDEFTTRKIVPFVSRGLNVVADTPALKNDSDKDPWHLAPWDAFRCVVKVMAFGAKKYAPRNWEKGFEWHRLHRATIEHLTSWWLGEDKDPETGYSHLYHAGCCIMFLIAHELRGIGVDDRPHKTVGK